MFKNGDDCCRLPAALAGLENELLIVESIAEVGMPAIRYIKRYLQICYQKYISQNKVKHHVSSVGDMKIKVMWWKF